MTAPARFIPSAAARATPKHPGGRSSISFRASFVLSAHILASTHLSRPVRPGMAGGASQCPYCHVYYRRLRQHVREVHSTHS